MTCRSTSTRTNYLTGTDDTSLAGKGFAANQPASGTGRFGYLFHCFHAIGPELVRPLRRSLMSPSDLPHLTIDAVEPDCWTGRYDPSKWVGEGWIGAIHLGGSHFIWGRFRNVNVASRTCSFCPDQANELSELRP